MSSSKDSSAAQTDEEHQEKETASELHESDKEQSSKDQEENSDKSFEVYLHVGNLKYETDEKKLEEIFSKYGKATARIIRRGGRSKGFGFVIMDSQENAQKAIEELNKTDLDGRTITVEFARSNGEEKPKSKGRSRRGSRNSRDHYHDRGSRERYRERRSREHRYRDSSDYDYDYRRSSRSRRSRDRSSRSDSRRRRYSYDYDSDSSPRRRHSDYSSD